MSKVHVKTGDTVMVMSGVEKGKIGKVLEVSPKEGKIIIEGVKKVKKHVKARNPQQPSGIVEAESPMYACKVQIYCSACKKPTRIKHVIGSDGSKERICAHKDCGAKL